MSEKGEKAKALFLPVSYTHLPKYRRKVIYKALRGDIIEIIKKLCKEMKVEIIEGEACPDHIHLRVSIRYVYSTVRGDAQEQKCADDFR